jgi:hypothetical protein
MKFVGLILLALVAGCLQKPKVVDRPNPVFIPQPPQGPLPPVPEPPTPDFITVEAGEDSMLFDVQSLQSDNERLDTFYMYGCDLYNAGADLRMIEQAANKLINSVSSADRPRRLTAFGPAGVPCIFRGDQSDYNLNNDKYRAIERALTLDFTPESIRAQNLQFLTQKRKPYFYLADAAVTFLQGDQLTNSDTNGDGLVDTGCGLYCILTEQPIRRDLFFDFVGVDFQREFDDEAAICSATNRSPIALGKGRIVCIVETDFGWLMTTWDSDQANQDSINLNPFPPEVGIAAGLFGDGVFNFNAQEDLATARNGLYIRRLNGADGLAQSEAPGNVVTIPDDRIHDGLVRLGLCSQCHSIIGKEVPDEAARIISSSPAFDADQKLAGEIFFNGNLFDAKLREINEAHREALARIGVDQTAVDPISEYLMKWIRDPYDARKAAAFAGLPTEIFLEQLRGTEVSSVVLASLFTPGATVSYADYQGNFPTLVQELNLFRDRDLNSRGY